MYRILFFFLLYSFFWLDCLAQQKAEDSLVTAKTPKNVSPGTEGVASKAYLDSIGLHTPFVTPKKSALFSAILPGLGQYNNKHYWKLPVIYAGVGIAAYFVHDNLTNYNLYRKLYAGFRNNNQELMNSTPYNENQVNQLKDYYRRNLDITILLSVLGYGLQVVDAVVYAHLKDFDISEDISLNARPVLMPQGGLGIGLVLKF